MDAGLLSMKKGLIVSILLHTVLIVGAFTCAASFTNTPPTLFIVLQDDDAEGGGGGGSQHRDITPKGITPPALQKAPLPKHRSSRRIPRQSVHKNVALSEDNELTTQQLIPQAASSSDAANLVPSLTGPDGNQTPPGGAGHGTGTGTGVGAGAGTGSGTGIGSGIGGGAGASVGPGKGSESAESLRRRYVKEHFTYIRDLIVRNLSYPSIARKFGWHGGVIVSFVVRMDGRTERIRVLKNSGYDVLDQNVVRTIKEVEPFPKPPVKAELTIPVVYRLE